MGDRARTLRPRDLIRGMCYWVLAVHGGLLAKMSGHGAMLHGGQTMKPCRKARRHVGHIEWASDLRYGPTRARHRRRPRLRRASRMY
ncbi:UNVERIFIED_CONTAM: hypothetical protein Sradi_1342300 [Sesamum radiatum]|uniref:Secreted protein n=1 Tax=Sesamum radiatum TaxID=300843 RepID=A0AAW2UQV1_SESRA